MHSSTNAAIVFMLLITVAVIAKGHHRISNKGSEEKSSTNNVERIKRDISDLLGSKEVQSRLPVEVDLSGIVDYLAQAFEKNFTALQNHVNQLEEEIKANGNKQPQINNNIQSKATPVLQMCNINGHATLSEGELSNLKPAVTGESADPYTGFSWKSILGGCVKNSSELDGWILLQHRDMKRAGDIFQKKSLKEYKDGFQEPPFPARSEVAFWYGLYEAHKLMYKQDFKVIKEYDMVLAYHCGGKVHCSRHGNSGIRKAGIGSVDQGFTRHKYSLWMGSELYREGMFPHLLEQFNRQYFKKNEMEADHTPVDDERLGCSNEQTSDHWFFMRGFSTIRSCPTLCPTCKKIGASIEEIGFDASNCTNTFIAFRRMDKPK